MLAGRCRLRIGVGVRFPRYFTAKLESGKTPYDEVAWELRTASIGNDKGAVIFEQRDVEVPADWSQTATNIVVSKYFYGKIGSPERETSVRQLIGRVVDTIADWGVLQRYFRTVQDAANFRDDLAHLMLTQKACFNSPVWFNVGVKEAARLRLVLRRGSRWAQGRQEAGIRANGGRSARRASSIRWAIRSNRFWIWPRPKACCSSGARARARIFPRCAKKTGCFRAAGALPVR